MNVKRIEKEKQDLQVECSNIDKQMEDMKDRIIIQKIEIMHITAELEHIKISAHQRHHTHEEAKNTGKLMKEK